MRRLEPSLDSARKVVKVAAFSMDVKTKSFVIFAGSWTGGGQTVISSSPVSPERDRKKFRLSFRETFAVI